jgi:hypothetical protein
VRPLSLFFTAIGGFATRSKEVKISSFRKKENKNKVENLFQECQQGEVQHV